MKHIVFILCGLLLVVPTSQAGEPKLIDSKDAYLIVRDYLSCRNQDAFIVKYGFGAPLKELLDRMGRVKYGSPEFKSEELTLDEEFRIMMMGSNFDPRKNISNLIDKFETDALTRNQIHNFVEKEIAFFAYNFALLNNWSNYAFDVSISIEHESKRCPAHANGPAKIMGQLVGPYGEPDTSKYIISHNDVLAYEKPTTKSTPLFSLKKSQEVVASFRTADVDEILRRWVKISAEDGSDGFVLLENLLTSYQIIERKKLEDKRIKMHNWFLQVGIADKPDIIGSNAVFYFIKECHPGYDILNGATPFVLALMSRRLYWSDGGRLHFVSVFTPDVKTTYNIKQAGSISLRGEPEHNIVVYAVNPLTPSDIPGELLGFTTGNLYSFKMNAANKIDKSNYIKIQKCYSSIEIEKSFILNALYPLVIELYPREAESPKP